MHLSCIFQPNNIKTILDSEYCTEEFVNKTVEYADINDLDHWNDYADWDEKYTPLTCLDLACIYQYDAVKNLLDSKFCTCDFLSLRKNNIKNYTYLHYACSNQPNSVDLILNSKVFMSCKDVFQYGYKDNKETILHIACKEGNLDLVKKIISHKFCTKEFFQAKYEVWPEVDLMICEYYNCLHLAIIDCKFNIFCELLKHKFCTNKFFKEECYSQSGDCDPSDYRSCLELICTKNATGRIRYTNFKLSEWLIAISKFCDLNYMKKIYRKLKKEVDSHSDIISIDHTLNTLQKCLDNQYLKIITNTNV